MEIYGKCPFCDGTGQTIADKEFINCLKCNGTGRTFLAEIDLDDIRNDLKICKRRLKKILNNFDIEDLDNDKNEFNNIDR